MDKQRFVPIAAGVAASVAVAALVAVKWYHSIKKQPQQEVNESVGPVVVTQLHRFPIKSCSSRPLNEIILTKRGVLYDREWSVFRRGTLKFCSQRDFPSMKRVCVTIVDVDGTPNLRAAVVDDAVACNEVGGRRPLYIPIRPRSAVEGEASGSHHFTVDIWGLSTVVADEGPEAAAWFSEYLGADVFVGRAMGPRHTKETAALAPHIPEASCDINLQDCAPLHLCTEEAVEYLQHELHDPTINVFRFRPNIVVRGAPFPSEECWATFRLVRNDDDTQPLNLKTVKLMDRCSMPTITDKGERNSKFLPTAFLKKTHAVAEHGSGPCPMFGLAVFHEVDAETFTTHKIRVGDRVEVKTQFPPRIYESAL
jgi:uncharacterized protein